MYSAGPLESAELAVSTVEHAQYSRIDVSSHNCRDVCKRYRTTFWRCSGLGNQRRSSVPTTATTWCSSPKCPEPNLPLLIDRNSEKDFMTANESLTPPVVHRQLCSPLDTLTPLEDELFIGYIFFLYANISLYIWICLCSNPLKQPGVQSFLLYSLRRWLWTGLHAAAVLYPESITTLQYILFNLLIYFVQSQVCTGQRPSLKIFSAKWRSVVIFAIYSSIGWTRSWGRQIDRIKIGKPD